MVRLQGISTAQKMTIFTSKTYVDNVGLNFLEKSLDYISIRFESIFVVPQKYSINDETR